VRQEAADRQRGPDLSRRLPLTREVARRWPELADSAEELIVAGAVQVDGLPATNPRTLVDAATPVRIAGEERTLRGRVKLAAALERFGIDATGAVALDAGASAGGFVQALLDAGARRVYAVEAGHGQLLGSLAQDERVVSLERTNVGALDRTLVPDPLDLVSLDVGYLPLASAVPQLGTLAFTAGAQLVGLVKPKDELGLGTLPADPGAAVDEAVARASAGMAQAGWEVVAAMPSPVTGSRGAVEALVHARRAA
jgi:23S rRNA (cytidine1920-2'-O)/16S rRNA (cytidine1409-2'-O)-methyltransferase